MDGNVDLSDDQNPDLPLLVRRLLAQRGISGRENIEKYLKPKLADLSDPFELDGMDEAVDRIFHAIDEKQCICIYGDYDVDGVSSVAILYRMLEAYGVLSHCFIPVRTREGYGLSSEGIKRAIRECGQNPDLLICVDCGTSSIDEVADLNTRGIDVIIVDHHEASPRGRPDALAIINAKLEEDSDKTYLCSAGVAFKLCHALLKRRRLAHFDLKQYLDLVAIATVADIVPLVRENRLLTRHGLRQVEQSVHIGITALNQLVGRRNPLTAGHISFRLGPRLNAAGRMDAPMDALNLLLCEQPSEVNQLANKLNDLNHMRQQEEVKIRDEAIRMMEECFDAERDQVIVLGSRSWHPGVVGIVASLLMRRYHKPTFVISFDEHGIGKGSGRSIPGVSLVQAIHHCHASLISGGGHEMAAGLAIAEDQLDNFRAEFNAFVKENTSKEQRKPVLLIDAEVQFRELSLELLDSYELLEPFGNANPQPVFMTRNVMLNQAPRRLTGGHMRLSLRQNDTECEAMYFNGSQIDLPDPPWDVAFTIDRNTWRGRSRVSLSIQDIRPVE